MPPKTSHVYINNILVVVYDYEKAGDTLPVHEHSKAPWTEHFVVVCRGEFVVLTGSPDAPIEKTLAGAGDIVTWSTGAPHGFRAKTDGARAMHVRAADLRDLTAPPDKLPTGIVPI